MEELKGQWSGPGVVQVGGRQEVDLQGQGSDLEDFVGTADKDLFPKH